MSSRVLFRARPLHGSKGILAALSATSVTVPHALGLGLLAFAPLAGDLPVGSLALWSAALPGAIMALAAARKGVIYAPTTIVGLMYAAILATVAGMAGPLGLSAPQILAVCGTTVAVAFGFQWLLGALRLASLSRFLPVSVMYGFAAGVGLSMVLSQFSRGFGTGHWSWDSGLALHALAALSVAALARLVQRRWPAVPGLLPAVVTVALIILGVGAGPQFVAAAPAFDFAWPTLPDWQGIPWVGILQQQGTRLASLALLMALVNSLDIVVFNQELELDFRLAGEPNRALRRESLIGAACALFGMIPASTSASRSRIALVQAGPTPTASPAHALGMLAVAATGTLWLPWLPMACLSGALILAGLTQIPPHLWSRAYARSAPSVWTQGWLVATVFAVAGGAGALVAGLVVATFVLMRTSASTALRRALLDGQARSRRLRRGQTEAWLTPRMSRVAVFEFQGMMSFGVSAHTSEQILSLLQPRHDRVIIDASRVGGWDATALVRLQALGHDLADRQIALAVCALTPRAAATVGRHLTVFADLDRALEWAEEAILAERSEEERQRSEGPGVLGELGEGITGDALDALVRRMRVESVAAQQLIFEAGATDRDLCIVQSGRVTLSTQWPPDAGIRLASIGRGMAFGEMAFLNGQPRTAFAGATDEPVEVIRLPREAFDAWAHDHPDAALSFMANLAITGTRRLGATTRQLRGLLE